MSTTLMSNYQPLPVTFTKGEGAWLWDNQGQRYLDALSGVAVCNLGHAHPAVTQALCEQAHTLLHTSNWYGIAHQYTLADQLTALAAMDKAFFCNSGAEANEAAIKIARLYGHRQGIKIPTILVTEGAFHGRTLATLTATGNAAMQSGFEPLLAGFVRVPYNDVAAINAMAQQHSNIVAVLLEPVTGEGGVMIPQRGYLTQVQQLCRQHNWLLIMDEIQTGMGRTGTWFAYQHEQLQPDIVTVAKGLGNGVPIGACLARGPAAELFQPGNHGSTFGGNPLACRAALAVIETLKQEHLLPRVQALGQYFYNHFSTALADVATVKAIRVKGLMIGIELDRPCRQLMTEALKHHLLINVTAQRVIRLLPPFILTDEQAQQIATVVTDLVHKFALSTH